MRRLHHEALETRRLLDGTGLMLAAEGEPLGNFALSDVNESSPSFNQLVSPRDFLGQTTAWYFGHST